MFSRIQSTLSRVALIKQIAVGLIIGVLIAIFAPGAIPACTILGDLFVKALKGIAPVLVFFLVMNAMAQRKENAEGSMKPIHRSLRSQHILCFSCWCRDVLLFPDFSGSAGGS